MTIVIFQEIFTSSGAQSLFPPMPQRQSVNPIFQNDPLVIPGIQRNFGHILRKQVMLSAAEKNSVFSFDSAPTSSIS